MLIQNWVMFTCQSARPLTIGMAAIGWATTYLRRALFVLMQKRVNAFGIFRWSTMAFGITICQQHQPWLTSLSMAKIFAPSHKYPNKVLFMSSIALQANRFGRSSKRQCLPVMCRVSGHRPRSLFPAYLHPLIYKASRMKI